MSLPSASEIKRDARLALYAFLILCVVCGLWVIRGWVSDPFGFHHRAEQKAHVEAVQATGAAAVSQAGGAAQRDATVIADKGRSRDARSEATHEANRAAIQQTTGADVSLDPAVIAVARRGLCEYNGYDGDPDCASLR